jgi:Fanconi-associated nuclease 1
VHRLTYHSDIANLEAAVEHLQAFRPLPASQDEDEEACFALPNMEACQVTGDKFTFADCSDRMVSSLEEAASFLSLEELKTVAKEARVTGKTKGELLTSFKRASAAQTGFKFSLSRSSSNAVDRPEVEDEDCEGDNPPPPGDSGGSPRVKPERPECGMPMTLVRSDTLKSNQENNSAAPESPYDVQYDGTNRDAYFTQLILSKTGPLIRLSEPVLRLFERVHLIYYRSTEWTGKACPQNMGSSWANRVQKSL